MADYLYDTPELGNWRLEYETKAGKYSASYHKTERKAEAEADRLFFAGCRILDLYNITETQEN